ncbi:Peptidase M20 [Macrophomina phaseolina MS6]|uniref:Peptidase M20 n=1 Tax=Macrophomina phaseolina (strain MS6) TaxID=1126212 RepID=K2S118_MACPH|nr:Peptidase M20 [Macrophomina phaseolina MS6]
MMRLALTDEDRLVRDWLCDEARTIGCEVIIDQMGSIFAVLPGENRKLPPIAMGSHLDTQPAGGRFDGVLGVLAGLEVLRSVRECGIKPHASLAVVCWTNEEGSRFVPGCTGSAVWAGHTSLRSAHARASSCGATTLGAELDRIAYRGETAADHRSNPLSAYMELHIEQGPRLEAAGQTIGVVDAIQGIRWFQVAVRGERAHSGATPMAKRADALLAASKVVVLVAQLSVQHGAFGTVGTLAVDNASPNVISDCVSFSIDLRHPSEAVLSEIEEAVREHMRALEEGDAEGRIKFAMSRVWHSPAQDFDPVLVECIQRAAATVCGTGESTQRMRSHAGHDSALVGLTGTPAAMIFVPSRNGISHAPEEWTDKEDCVAGADTLFQAVLHYDDLLRQRTLKTEVKDGGQRPAQRL